MLRRALVPVVLLFVWALVHCSRRPAALQLEQPLPPASTFVVRAPASLDELRDRLEAVLARERVPGAAFALVGPDGPVWVGGVGVRDRETRVPVDADTVFRVGSLTKTVVALGVMRLVDQGKLDLDRPLRELLPGVVDNPWEAEAPVTLAQCLEHTAGLDDVRFNEIFTDDEELAVAATLALNPRSRVVRWRPGTRHAYSNVGYTIAGRAIEVVTGERFDAYLRREILAPLGIRDADFKRTPTLTPRLSSGHFDDHRIAAFLPFAHRPSGSLLASASDLGKLVDFWARRGEGYPPIVSAAGLARIERNGTLPYRPLASDYGLANYGDVSYSVLGRGHDGGMPGFHATIRYYPELRIGFAMLLNANYTFRGYRDIRALLYAYLTRDRELPPRRALPSPVDKPTADFYALAAPRAAVFAFIDTAIIGSHVLDAGDRLHVTELFDNSHYDLVPSTDGAYAYAGDHGSSVRFTSDRHGTPVMVTGFSYGEAAPWWLARLRYSLLAAAMLLMKLAPIVAIGLLLFSAIERRRILPLSLALWPALAALCCPAIPHLLETAFLAGVVGTVHPLTVAVCALTIGFAVASVASLVCVTRWALRPDRPHLLALVFPAMCGLAFTGLTVWLGLHGMIGFRTWAW